MSRHLFSTPATEAPASRSRPAGSGLGWNGTKDAGLPWPNSFGTPSTGARTSSTSGAGRPRRRPGRARDRPRRPGRPARSSRPQEGLAPRRSVRHPRRPPLTGWEFFIRPGGSRRGARSTAALVGAGQREAAARLRHAGRACARAGD